MHETVEVSVVRLLAGAGHEPQFPRAGEVVVAVGDALALRSDAVPADARQERP